MEGEELATIDVDGTELGLRMGEMEGRMEAKGTVTDRKTFLTALMVETIKAKD